MTAALHVPLERHTRRDLPVRVQVAIRSLLELEETAARADARLRATPPRAPWIPARLAAARSAHLDTHDARAHLWALLSLEHTRRREYAIGVDTALSATPALPLDLGGHPAPRGNGASGPVSRPSLTLLSSSSRRSHALVSVAAGVGNDAGRSSETPHRTPDGNTGGPPAAERRAPEVLATGHEEELLELLDVSPASGEVAQVGPVGRTATPPVDTWEPCGKPGCPVCRAARVSLRPPAAGVLCGVGHAG